MVAQDLSHWTTRKSQACAVLKKHTKTGHASDPEGILTNQNAVQRGQLSPAAPPKHKGTPTLPHPRCRQDSAGPVTTPRTHAPGHSDATSCAFLKHRRPVGKHTHSYTANQRFYTMNPDKCGVSRKSTNVTPPSTTGKAAGRKMLKQLENPQAL